MYSLWQCEHRSRTEKKVTKIDRQTQAGSQACLQRETSRHQKHSEKRITDKEQTDQQRESQTKQDLRTTSNDPSFNLMAIRKATRCIETLCLRSTYPIQILLNECLTLFSIFDWQKHFVQYRVKSLEIFCTKRIWWRKNGIPEIRSHYTVLRQDFFAQCEKIAVTVETFTFSDEHDLWFKIFLQNNETVGKQTCVMFNRKKQYSSIP